MNRNKGANVPRVRVRGEKLLVGKRVKGGEGDRRGGVTLYDKRMKG